MSSTTSDAARLDARWFYVWMACVCVLIAFGGFIPTYWAKLAAGTFNGAPIFHIHGLLFFTWTLFFLAQTSLILFTLSNFHRSP